MTGELENHIRALKAMRFDLEEARGQRDALRNELEAAHRQIRRLQTGEEIESDRLTDHELAQQVEIDALKARVAELESPPVVPKGFRVFFDDEEPVGWCWSVDPDAPGWTEGFCPPDLLWRVELARAWAAKNNTKPPHEDSQEPTMGESNTSYEARLVLIEYMTDPKKLLRLGKAMRKVAGPWEKFTPTWDSHAHWCRRDAMGNVVTHCLYDSERETRDATLRNEGFKLVDDKDV